MAEDRFIRKNTRVRQSEAITAHSEEKSLLFGFDNGTKAQQWLERLRQCMAHPLLRWRPPWVESFEETLGSGRYELSHGRLIGALANALECQERHLKKHGSLFIGPIQMRPKKPITNATKKWRANAEALSAMQAQRPLKPPGR